jgi:putative glutamine amidotransferase
MQPVIGIGTDLVEGGSRERVYAWLTYVEAVIATGGAPLLIPPQPENLPLLVSHLDGVLLTGGADCDPAIYGSAAHPSTKLMDVRRQANDLALAALARARGIPTLGICLGSQLMAVAAGGTLVQDIASESGSALQHTPSGDARCRHAVVVEADSILRGVVGEEIDVNSSHHQSVREAGKGLSISAHAPDGVVEAIEDRAHPFYIGVQWHPEEITGEPHAAALFAAFVEAATRYAERKRGGEERGERAD